MTTTNGTTTIDAITTNNEMMDETMTETMTNMTNMTNMTSIVNAPLTNEELAIYYNVLSNMLNGAITSAVKMVCASQTAVISEGFEKLLNNINHKFEDIKKTVSGAVTAQTEFNTRQAQFNTQQAQFNTLAMKLASQLVESSNSNAKTMTELFADSQERLAKTMLDITNRQQKWYFATAKELATNKADVVDNPRFTNSIDESSSTKWIRNVWGICGAIGRRRSIDKKNVLFEMFDILREQHPEIREDFRSYKQTKPNSSQISMCGHSDFYRPIVDGIISQMHMKYFPESYTVNNIVNKNLINSVTIMKSPDCIRDIIAHYAKTHNLTHMSATYRLYYKLATLTERNIKKESREYASSLGYKNCSTGYYVANNSELFQTFKSIAEVK